MDNTNHIGGNREYVTWRQGRNRDRFMAAGERLWLWLWEWRIPFLLLAALFFFMTAGDLALGD